MKELGPVFVWPLVVGLMLWMIQITNQPRPELVFTLSSPIEHPLMRSGKSVSSRVQQLVITNSGTVAAKNIILKFRKPISDPDLRKFTEADKATLIKVKPLCEVSYEELRPRSEFKVSFLSNAQPIRATDLLIKHSDGDAQEAAQAAQQSTSNSLISKLSGVFFYFLMLFYLVMASTDLLEKILKRKVVDSQNTSQFSGLRSSRIRKPWYCPEVLWNHVLNSVLNLGIEYIARYPSLITDIKKTVAYSLLSEDRPDFVRSDLWPAIIEHSEKALADFIRTRLNAAYSIPDIINLSEIPKPHNFSESGWQKVRQDIEKQAEAIFTRRAKYSISDGINLLKMKSPASLSPGTWSAIRKSVKESFLQAVNMQLTPFGNPLKALAPFDLSKIMGEEFNEMKSEIIKQYMEKLDRDLRHSREPLQFLADADLEGLTQEQLHKMKDDAILYQSFITIPSLSNPEKLRQFIEAGKPDWLSESEFQRYVSAYDTHQNWEDKYRERQERLEQRLNIADQTAEESKASLALVEDFLIQGRLPEERPAHVDEKIWRQMHLIATSWKTPKP